MCNPSKPSYKGNKGEYARQRLWWKRVLVGVTIVPIVCFLASKLYSKYFGGGHGRGHGRGRHVDITTDLRERLHRTYSKEKSVKDVVENYWTMVHLEIPHGALATNQNKMNDRRYGPVRAIFCEIDWSLQVENPSTVPFFRDLQYKSSRCMGTKTTVDLNDVVQQAKAFDGFDELTQTSSNKSVVFPPNGVVFHESRCGSTLFANMLAGFAPGRSRVIVENLVTIHALHGGARSFHPSNADNIDPILHKALIRDVYYMLGRRPPAKSKEEEDQRHLFFKISSIGSLSIELFTMAFPEVPWVFMYRDTVEVLQSLLRQGRKEVPKVCTRYHKLGAFSQPKTTKLILKDAGISFFDLKPIQYCAAHIAALSLSAVQEYDRSLERADPDAPGGRFVDYHQMPDVVWNEILPNHFGVNPLPPDAIDNLKKTAGVYSKGRGIQANEEWTEDSTAKKDTAADATIAAADRFVSKVFNRMKELSSS